MGMGKDYQIKSNEQLIWFKEPVSGCEMEV